MNKTYQISITDETLIELKKRFENDSFSTHYTKISLEFTETDNIISEMVINGQSRFDKKIYPILTIPVKIKENLFEKILNKFFN